MAPDGPTVVEARGGVRIGEQFHDWGAVVRSFFGGNAGECIGRGYLRRTARPRRCRPSGRSAASGSKCRSTSRPGGSVSSGW